MIEVKVIGEFGYDMGMFGNGLSFGKTSGMDFDSDWDKEATAKVIKKLAPIGGGHNKSLEQIQVWLDVNAPRYWHSEADTYRLSTKLSESSIHTLARDGITSENMPLDLDPELPDEVSEFMAMFFLDISTSFEYIQGNEGLSKKQKTILLKKMLPEAFMQRRIWKVDYKTLQNIILQRRNHLLPEWQVFCKEILSQVEHPELLPSLG